MALSLVIGLQLMLGARMATAQEVPESTSGLYRVLATDIPNGSTAVVAGREIAVAPWVLEAMPERLMLELLDGEWIEADRDFSQRLGAERILWQGWAEARRVIRTLKAGILAGRIEAADGVYTILPLPGGGHWLAKHDLSLFPPCGGGVEPPNGFFEETVRKVVEVDPPDGIDVMALYTPQARDAAGGTAAIEATIQSAVDVTNAAFLDSDMIARFNLVHTALAAYDDSGNISADLSWVANDPGVAALRDLHAADMVSLITEGGGGFCGIAYVMRNPGPGFESAAFQVTVRGCAVGNLTWAHEHGHNMGFEHDPANGPLPGQASYEWSFAHFVDGSFRTVMSYANQCTQGCPRVGHFSNPAISYLGSPTGISDQRDNHRTGDLTAPIVTDFRISCLADADCDNGLFCDGAETCNLATGLCENGVPICDDGVSCTDDCNETTDECESVPNDMACDNGLYCDGAETCDPVLGCRSGSDPCDDGVSCTVDVCQEADDVCGEHFPDDGLCDNGLYCDGTETCDPVLDCQPGSDPCDDGVSCTVDLCEETDDACGEHVPDDGLCDNGLFCDGAETCDSVLDCQAGSDPCPPPSLACEEASDMCVEALFRDNFESGDTSGWASTLL